MSPNRLHYLWAGLAVAMLDTWLPTVCPAATADDEPLARQPALSFQRVVVDEQPPGNPWTKLAGDFNGDGKLDVAIAGQNGPLVWYVNPGWQKVQVAERGWSTVGGAVGDVDGDGDADLVPGAQVWFENPRLKGDPAKDPWRLHRISAVGSHDVALVDLDRDGKPDLVARDQSSFGHKTGNKIHFGRQAGPDQWSHHVVDCPHGEGLAVADFNGDGRPDILGANHGGPRQPVELWLSQVPKRTAVGPLRVHPTNPRDFTDGTTSASGALKAVYLTGSLPQRCRMHGCHAAVVRANSRSW